MKSLRKVVSVIALSVASLFCVNAQVDMGVDLYSTYVWRGIQYTDGPAIQPWIEYSAGDFAIGAWGSQGYDGFQEMDLYVSYSLGDLSLGLTDYYYTGVPYFEFDDVVGSHALEFNLGYAIGDLSIAANYIFNDSSDGGAASAGDDMYFELGYAFESFDIFVGGGDGWHTSDGNAEGEFAISNVGISTSKEIKITDSFSLPVSASAILNPDTEQFYIVAGISF